jgi:multidrug efflux pump subunit AcrA (membrane-fusion protein)
MLNISNNKLPLETLNYPFSSMKKTETSNAKRYFRIWIWIFTSFSIAFLFLPWTQNIQSDGKTIPLNPADRPQTIDATISGRIEKWFVKEGDRVKKGDTILFLSEVKADYFDPNLVSRSKNRVVNKEGSIEEYLAKIQALNDFQRALKSEVSLKQQMINNKIYQTELKIDADSIDLNRVKLDLQIAGVQLDRTISLNAQGIKSVAEVEDKKFKMQELIAKRNAAENKWNISRNEKVNLQVEEKAVLNDFIQKSSKINADIAAARAAIMDTESHLDKLRSEASNYEIRNAFYYITAPQDCFITKILKPGLGEIVKENESVITILPSRFPLAVELFIRPMDLPLIERNQEVRFIFDGWPAIVFSGWPDNSFGTFEGKIVAVDNDISENGLYRIIVAADEKNKKWPKDLRPGSGAKGIALLGDVPLWYEVWRKLNGFPPDFYGSGSDNGKTEKKDGKAPIKSLK